MTKDAYLDYLDYRGVDYEPDNVPQDYVHDYLHRWADQDYSNWVDASDDELVRSKYL